ncbi:hypothetical protein GCM10008943_34140 [Paenochrobactrum glaciei]|uniref:Transposase n=1 Tax=Paenochrobactrum glaciei TaxID=486407 RepID=A0ABN1GQQ8_9HYPH
MRSGRILVTSERGVVTVASDLGIGKSTLDQWRRLFADKDLLADPHSDVQQELDQLRHENELLYKERDLLKKTAVDSTCQRNINFQ